MAIDMSKAPIPKGEPRRIRKGRQRRQEGAVKKSVRAQCVERDGHCRIAAMRDGDRRYPATLLLFCGCAGPSQWAHRRGFRRSLTRGMAPEERHTTGGTLMLCEHHHSMEEEASLKLLISSEAGCDGSLGFRVER